MTLSSLAVNQSRPSLGRPRSTNVPIGPQLPLNPNYRRAPTAAFYDHAPLQYLAVDIHYRHNSFFSLVFYLFCFHRNASCSGHHGALKGYTLVPERLDFGSMYVSLHSFVLLFIYRTDISKSSYFFCSTIGEVALRYIQIHGKNSTIKLIRTVPVDMTMFYLLSTEVNSSGSCVNGLAGHSFSL